MDSDNNNSQIVCRFCLQYSQHMMPLETVYNREKMFLEKVYQCAQINIIDLDELQTWVCEGCLDSIGKFYSFRSMLQQNLTDFNERFRAEQKEHQYAADWSDSQQLEVIYSDFSDCDDCYEVVPTDSEYDTEGDTGIRDRKKPAEHSMTGLCEAAEIEAEFAEIVSDEGMGSFVKLEVSSNGSKHTVESTQQSHGGYSGNRR